MMTFVLIWIHNPSHKSFNVVEIYDDFVLIWIHNPSHKSFNVVEIYDDFCVNLDP
jgi:hypothetical protein